MATSLDLLEPPPTKCCGNNLMTWLTSFYYAVKDAVAGGGGAGATFPIGFIGYTAATTPDPGWLFCYGQAVSRTTYAALFAKIGTTFGAGDGTTTFNMPDDRGRAIAGKDNMGGSSANVVTNAQADILGGVMGAELHTLSTAELSVHAHSITVPNSSTTYGAGPGDPAVHRLWSGAGAGASTGNAGSGTAHNNMQPTLFLNTMIYAGV